MSRDALPRPNPALFPGAEDRRHVDDWLTEELAQALERVQAGLVVPTLDMNGFRAELHDEGGVGGGRVILACPIPPPGGRPRSRRCVLGAAAGPDGWIVEECAARLLGPAVTEIERDDGGAHVGNLAGDGGDGRGKR